MALIGKIEEYDEKESWIDYTERLEKYFAANKITDSGEKQAVLLSVCGAKTYKLIRNLVNPRKPNDKSFAELENLVKNHLNPRPSSIVYCCKFNSRFRQQGETIQQYVAELRNLSEHCEFGDQLEKMRSCTTGLQSERRTHTAEIASRKSIGVKESNRISHHDGNGRQEYT